MLESGKELTQLPKFVHSKDRDDTKFFKLNLTPSAPFESKIGEYGLAWLGNIVLFFAIVFLWQYFNNIGKLTISFIVGAISVAGVFTMSHYFRKSFTYLSFLFHLFEFIILYYILLRLHFYTAKPIITNQLFATILMLSAIAVQLYFAVKKVSQYLLKLH